MIIKLKKLKIQQLTNSLTSHVAGERLRGHLTFKRAPK